MYSIHMITFRDMLLYVYHDEKIVVVKKHIILQKGKYKLTHIFSLFWFMHTYFNMKVNIRRSQLLLFLLRIRSWYLVAF